MVEYLINVGLASSSYWMVALVMFMMGLFYRKKLGEFWPAVKTASGLLFFVGLFVGLGSSANTYKHEVNYNRSLDQKQIENYRDSNQEFEIIDRTRKPLSPEELQGQSVDMRERIENLEQNQ